MAEEVSPFRLAKDIGAQIAQLVANIDVDSLPREQRELLMLLKNQATDVRLDIRDYGMAETSEQQTRLAKEAADRLKNIQVTIVKVSEYNLLGAADTAQLSAMAEQLIATL